MSSTTPIRIVVTGDSEDAKRALRDLDGSLATTEGRLSSFGTSLTNFGRISALVSLGTDAVALAGNLAPAFGILAALPAVISTATVSFATLAVGLHGVTDAFKDTAAGAQALANLAPNARSFVEVIKSLAPAFQSLREQVQNTLFANLSSEIQALAGTSFPMLRAGMTQTASGFNEITVAAVQAMQTPMFQGAMANAFSASKTILDQFTPAVSALMTGLSNLSNVALPFLERFTGWLAASLTHVGVFLQTAEGAERMRQVLDKAVEVLQRVWAIGKDVVTVFANLFKAADASNMLGVLQQITSELAQWSGTAEGQQTLQTLFTTLGAIAPSLASNLPTILSALSSIAGAFKDLPEPVQHATSDIFAWSIVLGPLVSAAGGAAGAIRGMAAATLELRLTMAGEGTSALAAFGVAMVDAALIAVGTSRQQIAASAEAAAAWIANSARAAVAVAISAAETAASWVAAGVAAVADAVVSAAAVAGAWIAAAATTAVDTAVSTGEVIASWLLAGATATASAIGTAAVVIGSWTAMAATSVAESAVMAASWLIAFWPIALIVVAVLGLTALIVLNWSTIRRVTEELWNNVSSATGGAWDWIYGKISGVVNWIGGIGGAIGRATSGMWDGMKNAAKDAFNFIAYAWNDTAGRLRFTVPGWVPVLGGDSFAMPQIPYLATGGMFSGFAVVGEKGPELVYSPNRLGVMSNSDSRSFLSSGSSDAHTEINFHPGSIQSNANPFDIANEIAWQQKTQRRAS